MAVTTAPRIPVTRWSASATDPFTRAQMDASHAAIDTYAARDEQGLDAAKGAPAIRGRWWFSTDTRKRLYRDDGAAFHELPLIAQQNDYTGVQTVALASESATQSTATNAPLGVTRPTATGHKSYFAMAKTAVRTWALGMAGTVADGSGETNALIWGAPDASMGIPTPLMYLGTAGTLRNTGTSYSGPYSAGTAGTTRIASGQFDANNAQVAAQGANTNVGLILAGQGTGPIVLQPTVGTAVLTVAPTLITAAQRLTVTAGGLDVAGSPSGYTDELRFTTATAAGSHAISTTDTGAGHLRSDHRGSGNTGDWFWANGTNAATTRMQLSGVGDLFVVGDIYVGPYAFSTGTSVTRMHARMGFATGLILAAEGDGANRDFAIEAKGTGFVGFYGDGDALRGKIDSLNNLLVLGPSNTMGRGATGAGSAYVQIGDDVTGAYVSAQHGTVANTPLQLRAKGTGNIALQTSGGSSLLIVTSTGHLVAANGASGAPTVTTGLGAGWSVAVTGTDTAGTVTLTNNTAGAVNVAALSALATVTFANSFTAAPKVVISPVTSFAVASQSIVGSGTTTFSISSTVLVATNNGNQFTFNYVVIGV